MPVDQMEKDPDYHKVMDYLYIGDKRTARDMEFLKDLGVTHIVNATAEVRNYFEKEPGFHYTKAPVIDSEISKISPYFDECVAFMHAAMVEGHSVLVHCQQGVSRSATIVVAYLISQGQTLTEAYTLVRQKRSVCKIRGNFVRQLVHWEGGLKAKAKKETEKEQEKEQEREKKKEKETETSAAVQGIKRKNDDELDGCEAKQAEAEAKRVKGPTMPPKSVKGPTMPPTSIKGPTMPPKRVIGVAGPPSKAANPLRSPKSAAAAERDKFFNQRAYQKKSGSKLPGM